MVDNKCVAGFSDDKSVNIWDIATEEVVASWEVHKVRDSANDKLEDMVKQLRLKDDTR